MDKRFTITIHDDNSFSQINLHKFVKKAIAYAVVFLMTLALIAVTTILYLDYKVDAVAQKKSKLEEAYRILDEHNDELRASIEQTQQKLDDKKDELQSVSDKLEDIEDLIGLNPPKGTPLLERADMTKVTSQQVAVLMKLVPNGSPIEYKGITSDFGYRIHPTLHTREFHRGSDMKAEMDTPVHATADGLVEYAGLHEKSGYGNLVILDHSFGFKTYFGHLNKVVVKSGQFVKKGALIAYTGNSGMSNGPHLHYEIRFIQRPLNPVYFVKWSVKNYKEIFEKEENIPWQSLITATSNLRVITTTTAQTQVQQSLPSVLSLREK
ncbi:peptidoglycan DD-metalloendopeptidase family protein [bacterium]|nr:peptidoglycan DD-metalloendopeptidase family protein [bacterium]MBU1884722.1 peptidoglycan DD-metalloendopeptidase family protein [bacterium]